MSEFFLESFPQAALGSYFLVTISQTSLTPGMVISMGMTFVVVLSVFPFFFWTCLFSVIQSALRWAFVALTVIFGRKKFQPTTFSSFSPEYIFSSHEVTPDVRLKSFSWRKPTTASEDDLVYHRMWLFWLTSTFLLFFNFPWFGVSSTAFSINSLSSTLARKDCEIDLSFRTHHFFYTKN